MNYDFIRQRLTDLRLKKGVSEYQMSLDLGHSRSYIQNIVSGRSKPSIEEFLYMCSYLNITPKAFFDEEEADPILTQQALDRLRQLPEKDILLLLEIMERLTETNP